MRHQESAPGPKPSGDAAVGSQAQGEKNQRQLPLAQPRGGDRGIGGPRLPQALIKVMRYLAATARLLVATDVDGTLAPITAHPADARILKEADNALVKLANLPSTRVALISGRSLHSLRAMGAPGYGVILSGSHGAEIDGLSHPQLDAGWHGKSLPSSGDTGPALTQHEQALYTRVLRTLTELIAGESAHSGAWIERKPLGVALHTRALSEGESAALIYSAEQELHALPVAKLHGKRIYEVCLREHTKGSALRGIRSAVRADRVVFLGDDETDEHGFRALGESDLGVRVGPGPTAAAFRVPDPQTAALLLHSLAELRAQTGVTPAPGAKRRPEGQR